MNTELSVDDLVDVVITVESVPRTQLVHLAVGDRAGLVLTRHQAAQIGRELIAASGHRARGHAAAAGGRAALGSSARTR